MAKLDLIRSESESRRFGYRVFRAAQPEIQEDAVLDDLIASAADVLILRIPADAQHTIPRLNRIGLPYFVADTLVYYRIEFSRWTPEPLKNTDLRFELLDARNLAVLDPLLDDIFADYRNHYSANPYLPLDTVLLGYKEWVSGFCAGAADDKLGWLAYLGDTPVAFCTCTQSADVDEGVLYGVCPSASGKGIYRDLIRFTGAQAKQRGVAAFKVSTQIQNLAVQKVWSSEGFRMDRALLTIHVTPFFSASLRPVEVALFTLEPQPDAPAVAVFEAALARCQPANFPTAGSVLVDRALHFHEPLRETRRYSARFSVPWADRTGTRELLATLIFDEAGRLVVTAYSTFRTGG
jgi:GNAT superfamily N-acetyltransferase